MSGSKRTAPPAIATQIPLVVVERSYWFKLLSLSILALLAGCAAPREPSVAQRPAELLVHQLDLPHLQPSHHRRWQSSLAVLPYAELRGNQMRIHHIRNCRYRSEDDYVVDYYDATFDLDRLASIDFIVVPFEDMPELAHTMLSFGFDDGRYVVVSAEARLEEGETYSPIAGLLSQYELMYVVGDERDLILLRTEHRQAEVYMYRIKTTPAQRREMLTHVAQRMNELLDRPEFYDTLTNNCTTNIVRHVNEIAPGRIPLDYRVLLPGASDRLAYELGLVDTDLPFNVVKRRAHINQVAHKYRDDPDFSAKIRQMR
jgi:hypothetical protein